MNEAALIDQQAKLQEEEENEKERIVAELDPRESPIDKRIFFNLTGRRFAPEDCPADDESLSEEDDGLETNEDNLLGGQTPLSANPDRVLPDQRTSLNFQSGDDDDHETRDEPLDRF